MIPSHPEYAGGGADLPRDIGGGLTLRRATRDDAERLAAFQGSIHREPEAPDPSPGIIAWVMDLMCDRHPTFRPRDFLLVEDTANGRIASSLCLISQTWAYDGIPFGLGRPELVATHPDYRRRGLVSAQMEVVHAWSAARGERMQGITGIPWYYRQFGYEMALELAARRTTPVSRLPKSAVGDPEPATRIRAATDADVPFLRAVSGSAARRHRLSTVRDEAMWRFEVSGRTPGSANSHLIQIIERGGAPEGYLALGASVNAGNLYLTACEVQEGTPWPSVATDIMRHLRATGEAMAQEQGQTLETLQLSLGSEHPLYEVAAQFISRNPPAYGWYIRVPDIAGFLRHVAPALERRLAASPFAGYSGELLLTFFRNGGARLAFTEGRLKSVAPWDCEHHEQAHAWFPDLCFLMLLTGYRSFTELSDFVADCGARDESVAALLNALFPKQPSAPWTVS